MDVLHCHPFLKPQSDKPRGCGAGPRMEMIALLLHERFVRILAGNYDNIRPGDLVFRLPGFMTLMAPLRWQSAIKFVNQQNK